MYVVYSPTLDKLIHERKINKVPYKRESCKWFPKVGDQCWNYQHDNMFTIVSVDTRSRNVILRWGFDDEYETVTIDKLPQVNLIFKDWGFDYSDYLSIFNSGFSAGTGVSMKGAEIRAFCAIWSDPQWCAVWGVDQMWRRYLSNEATYKINDNTYYRMQTNDRGFLYLTRDLDKSPRHHETSLGEGSNPGCPSIADAPYSPIATERFLRYNINDTILQMDIEEGTRRRGIIRSIIYKLLSFMGVKKSLA